MENASKALIIAGAILIAIVLITIGVVILGQGQEVAQNANMSETEISTFNSKFTQFEGTNVRGSLVKQLYKTVLTNNMAEKSTGRLVGITIDSTSHDGVDTMANNASTLPTNTGKTGVNYTVKCSYNSSTGLVNSISIKSN